MGSRVPWRRCTHHGRGGLFPGLPCSPSVLRRPQGVSLPSVTITTPSRLAHDGQAGRRQRASNPLVNPPSSTRPPALNSPQRSAFNSTFPYLFQLGKAYLTFYKNGLKSVWGNRKLLREKLERTPAEDRPSVFRPYHVPESFSRADWVLLWRVRHDLLRLPLFGLMLIVIGEFTAFVVVYVDGVVPYTCRIPKQIYTSLQKAEQRRKAAFDELDGRHPHGALSPRLTAAVARKHVLRSLHLTGTMWDRLAFTPPGMWQLKGKLRMAFLEGDDRRLIVDGGPLELEPEELRIACSERGIDIIGKSETRLRALLGDWLRLTAAEDATERRRRMATLLLTRPENWPQQRNFAVPSWEL